MEVSGQVDTRFGPVRECFAEVIRGQAGTGAAFAAFCDGRLVADLWGGWARPAACLFRLDPARQVLPADRFQQRRVVGGQVSPDHPDHLVIAVAAGDVPAFASDKFHLAAPLWPFRPA